MIGTPKCNSDNVSVIGRLFTPENKFKLGNLCSTPEADLKEFPTGSKNIYPEELR